MYGASAPNHSDVYQSYFLRRPEIVAELNRDLVFIETLIAHAHTARTPMAACEVLGLSQHPSVGSFLSPTYSNKHRCRHTAYSRVIYHSGPQTLYGPIDISESQFEKGIVRSSVDAVGAVIEHEGSESHDVETSPNL